MEADRRLLGRVEVLSCGEKVKNKKGAHKPKYDALRVTTTGCETLDGRKDVNSYKKKSPKKSGDVVGDERHRRALSLLCTSLDQAIAMVLDGREADVCSAGKFSFVAPRQSLEFLRSGKLEDDAPPPPPSARRAMAQQQVGESDASSMIFPS